MHYRVRVSIHGLVQGVGFRRFARKKARELGLTGYVRNCADGSVEAEVQGNEAATNRFIQWSYQGAPHARVDRVVTANVPMVDDDHEFRIIE
ncbi:MAG: acylphosphatase [Bacteroidetes bacterium]|nr:acylphosphatase [Bacteroidota bacterium]